MSESITVTRLGDGMQGFGIPSSRFKTTRIHISLFLPLQKATAAQNALLPFLLTRACRRYPDYSALNRRLAELYGATLYADVDKMGDRQVLSLLIAGLNDAFASDGTQILTECAALLRDLLFDPPVENGLFCEKDLESEKERMVQRIEGELNEKRVYAINRLTEEMCADEPFGLPRYGTVEEVRALTAQDMAGAWKRVLREAFVNISVTGQKDTSGIFRPFSEAFAQIQRAPAKMPALLGGKAPKEPRMVEETMGVTQGKLVLGFRTGAMGNDRAVIAVRMMADMLGGGPYSLCFENVREKRSLCYYCAAHFNRHKGLLLIDSGIEEENRQKAYDAILEQAESMRKGAFSEELLHYSKLSMMDAAKGVYDSPSALDQWFTDRIFNETVTPEEYGRLIASVTKDQVVTAANALQLDTVYFLGKNKE